MSELRLQQCRLDGRYDILECLGRGSYAEVYLARDAAAGGGSPQMVVIKALNLFLQGSIDQELEHTLIENFRNEAVALDRVRHPNIINRLGHGTAIDMAGTTFHYLVLEYLPGGDMAALCRSHPLTLDRALYYLDQICDGLAHAHEHDVIHRDIKPQNLLLTADRQVVKIADFGVAKIEATEGLITRVGTDVYAAPEHHPLMQAGVLGTGSLTSPVTQLTPAADVYSLAKTAYMLLTGEAPRRFSQRPITELPAHMADAPWASFVLRVLRRGTETNPAKRYQSVRDFWNELSDALMPKTQLLTQPNGEETRPLSQVSGAQRVVPLPPEPSPAQFEPQVQPQQQSGGAKVRPRIVVPVALAEPPKPQAKAVEAAAATAAMSQTSNERKMQTPPKPDAPAAKPKERGATLMPRKTWFTEHARPWIVALLLLAGFALLLLGIQYQVRSRQRSAPTAPASTGQSTTPANPGGLQVGREMTTTTNVNLRSGAGRTYNRIGEVESGSRVRILQVSGNWCEVEIIQRGFPRLGEESADQGWIDGTRLR
ncbi:MAG TPA: serine/threonine protein kinase [Pyrinomonadaceae bacterium]|jgi:serine/threonine protein kinase|nr:serine/threonine protein kinase [Pyrinomonadaceae bacterium]